jgi:hypothetical protein
MLLSDNNGVLNTKDGISCLNRKVYDRFPFCRLINIVLFCQSSLR